MKFFVPVVTGGGMIRRPMKGPPKTIIVPIFIGWVVGLSHAADQGGDCVMVDFETKGNGDDLNRGDYVRLEWKDAYGMTVTASGGSRGGGFTPEGGMGRIFDTSETGGSNGDPDLGSPNRECGGPGVGEGGEPGRPGENCDGLGNVLIVQESDKDTPDDNAKGGTIMFEFDDPVTFRRIGLFDMDENETPMIVWNGSTDVVLEVDGLGNNAVQIVDVDEQNVLSLELVLSGSGAVTFLDFCLPTTGGEGGEGNNEGGGEGGGGGTAEDGGPQGVVGGTAARQRGSPSAGGGAEEGSFLSAPPPPTRSASLRGALRLVRRRGGIILPPQARRDGSPPPSIPNRRIRIPSFRGGDVVVPQGRTRGGWGGRRRGGTGGGGE